MTVVRWERRRSAVVWTTEAVGGESFIAKDEVSQVWIRLFCVTRKLKFSERYSSSASTHVAIYKREFCRASRWCAVETRKLPTCNYFLFHFESIPPRQGEKNEIDFPSSFAGALVRKLLRCSSCKPHLCMAKSVECSCINSHILHIYIFFTQLSHSKKETKFLRKTFLGCASQENIIFEWWKKSERVCVI